MKTWYRLQGGGGGGGIDGLSDSILEVPTYALALVFLFFLVGSYAFELVRGVPGVNSIALPCPA